MPTEIQIKKALENVLVPGVGRSLIDLNLLKGVEVTNSSIKVTIASAALGPGTQEWVKAKVQGVIEKMADTKEISIEFVEAKAHDLNKIDRVISILSGKGGVGKSIITGLTAIALARQGKKVGILDADITGPSIPRMFGTKARPIGSDTGILPIMSHLGIEVMSINLMLDQEDDAVIWRGPVISGVIKQFWEEVLWGQLDYLIVDLPPGTADATLTVMQLLPLTGVIIVSTPQDLTNMVVRKAVNMAQKIQIPILGVVENMSYFISPETGTKFELFGPSKAHETAKAANTKILGKFPIEPELTKLCDEGKIELYNSEAFKNYTKALTEVLNRNDLKKSS